MLKILVVDDEALARERLKRMVQQLKDSGMALNVVGEASNGIDALEQADLLSPDLLLLDVRMPGMDGLTAAQKLAAQEYPPAVIFCTAYNDFALQAFEAEALGYLVKPIKLEELRRNLERVAKLFASRGDSASRSKLISRTHQGLKLVNVADIRLLQADQKYVTAYYPNGELLLTESLKQLEEQYPDTFIRVHRNALVGQRYITGMINRDNQLFITLDGVSVEPLISRRLESQVRKIIADL